MSTVLRVRAKARGWRSAQRQTGSGAVESTQGVLLDAPVVEFSEAGVRALGRRYWDEVERSTIGLVRARSRNGSLELRLLGRGPLLLRFASPELRVSPTLIRCTYPIAGGALAQRPQGEISFSQTAAEELELDSTIRDFYPTLAARKGGPHWTGALYNLVQSRVHIAISRRYFRRLIAEAPR